MPSLLSPSEISAIGDNVIPQLNSILKGTPLAPIRTLHDITPSLLLDLYELLFHIKLAYATPRDHSAESQLRNIRVLIGHIAHDILKMDLSFLEPQKICMRDERALADFLRIFLGVTKLRKAHLEKGHTSGSTARRKDDDDISLDGSEHTIRATPSQENTVALRRHDEKRIVVRSLNSTPQKRLALNKTLSATATPQTHSQSSRAPLRSYKSYGHIEITEREISLEHEDHGIRRRPSQQQIPRAPAAPPSDTSSVPSDFIHNVNERVSHIWNKLNSRTNRQISDRISERPSSHSPRRPLSTAFSETGNLPAVPEDTVEISENSPIQPQDGPSLQEPTPLMKAWLDKTDAETSSHQPRSTQSTPQKPIPPPSTHTAPADTRTRPAYERALYSSPEESPLRPQHYTIRSKSSQHIDYSQRTPPKFALRRTVSEPKFTIDLAKAMFSNDPIRLPRQSGTQNQENDSSDEDDVDGDDTESEAPPSPTSSIATSTLSVSSVEWTDTASIAELRKKRLEALEDVKRKQEAAAKVADSTPERRAYTPSKLKESVSNDAQPSYVHHRRRSSIPSTFMHHRKDPQSELSYQTISPNSSASVAAERLKARWQAEAEMEAEGRFEGSPVPRGNSNISSRRFENGNYDEGEYDEAEGGYGEEYEDEEYDDDDYHEEMTKNTDDLEMELKGLDQIGLSESKRQIMLFEKLIRRAVDKRPLGK